MAALLATLAALQRGTGADLAAEARRAIRAAAAAPPCERARASWAAGRPAALQPPSPGDAPGQGVAAVLAEWYAGAVLADQRCLGVAVSEARCAPAPALGLPPRGRQPSLPRPCASQQGRLTLESRASARRFALQWTPIKAARARLGVGRLRRCQQSAQSAQRCRGRT